MSVGTLCQRDVVMIAKEASIVEAAMMMREQHVGCLVVADKSNGEHVPLGMITDRDLVVEVIAQEVDWGEVTVGDIMSDDLLTVQENDDLMNVTALMRDHGVRRVPVVNEYGGLVGILAVDDLIDLIAQQLVDLVRLMVAEANRERLTRS